MNVTTILGSPRRAGNTARVLKAFERLAASRHEVFRINVVEKNIGGCLGCDACQQNMEDPGCRQNDDFARVVARLLRSDVIVYASPVYVWDFTAQMKALIDRHCCLVKWKRTAGAKHLLARKRTMLLATCGNDAANNADLLQEVFAREMEYLRCAVLGAYIVPFCAAPAELGDRAETTARAMMKDLR